MYILMENKRQTKKTRKKILIQAYKKLRIGNIRHCGGKNGVK